MWRVDGALKSSFPMKPAVGGKIPRATEIEHNIIANARP